MTLQELNALPQFAGLNYGEQTQLRSMVVMQEAQALPGFSSLRPEEQAMVVKSGL